MVEWRQTILRSSVERPDEEKQSLSLPQLLPRTPSGFHLFKQDPEPVK